MRMRVSRGGRFATLSARGRCVWSCIGAMMLAATAGALGQSPPNLIFILTDDQGIDAVQGADWSNGLNCHTPQLANLARRGRSFTTVRVNPVCSPTRACLLTGRSANETGIYHIVRRDLGPPQERIKRSLQTQEWTIAEALRKAGYYTALVGKWHLGVDAEGGVTPQQQGFDVFIDGSEFLPFDDPIAVGDELITMMVDQAVDAVRGRPDPSAPYALFFWTNDPHDRTDPSQREPLGWWRVADSLLPSGEPYYKPDRQFDTERDRYRAVVEALDTELGRMLVELQVINGDGRYRSQSRTVVLVTSDNGTPSEVTEGPGKGSLYEPGVRVPLVVFGENVPADGRRLDRLVSAVDVFDTLADIAALPADMRGRGPRDGLSFAGEIGWGEPGGQRRYTLSSRGPAEQVEGQWVALADDRFKLITRAGAVGFIPPDGHAFYDLAADPLEEHDLVQEGMNAEQQAQYLAMRDAVVDYWCSAVGLPISLHVDVPLTHSAAATSLGTWHTDLLPIGFGNSSDRAEAIALYRFDIESISSLLPQGKTLDDVESAQVVVQFGSDANSPSETDIGPISAYTVALPWWRDRPGFADLKAAIAPPGLGMVDLPPHLLPDSGQPSPIVLGSLISLGHNVSLLDAIHLWNDNPQLNNGLALVAEPLPELTGDQFVLLQRTAVLRLTLRP